MEARAEPLNTEIYPPEKLKKGFLLPWAKTPTPCWACGVTFPTLQSCRAHLSHCRCRMLTRWWKCTEPNGRTFLFTVLINPTKDKRAAIEEVVKKKSAAAMIGVFEYLQKTNGSWGYRVSQINESEKLRGIPDGRVFYQSLVDTLTEKESRAIEAQVADLEDVKTERKKLFQIRYAEKIAESKKLYEVKK